MFKEKKMRKLVEDHLHQVLDLLDHAKKDDDGSEVSKEIIGNYISQKLALEYVLRDFERMGV